MRMVLLLSAALASLACTPTVEFDVPIEGDTVIPNGGLLGTLASLAGLDSFVTADSSFESAFSNQDVRKDQVTSTRLQKLTLSITGPAGAKFDFLDSIAFTATAPGQAEAGVASKTVDHGASTFDCDIADVDLAPYVKAESMSITTDVTGRQPDQDTTVHVLANFHVVAKVVGD